MGYEKVSNRYLMRQKVPHPLEGSASCLLSREPFAGFYKYYDVKVRIVITIQKTISNN